MNRPTPGVDKSGHRLDQESANPKAGPKGYEAPTDQAGTNRLATDYGSVPNPSDIQQVTPIPLDRGLSYDKRSAPIRSTSSSKLSRTPIPGVTQPEKKKKNMPLPNNPQDFLK